MTKRITKVCKDCGGNNVEIDAWACWDDTAQEWVLKSTYDASHCEDCDGPTTIIDVEIPDTEC